jgi:hypothetical protein
MALVQPRLFADAVLLPQRHGAAWDDVERDLRRIFALTREAGARPMLIFAPAVQQVTAAAKPYLDWLGFEWDDRTLTDITFADRLRALAREEHVTFVDLLFVLRARRDDGLYFPEDGHWSPAGHAHVAHVVAAALERVERDLVVPRTNAAGCRSGPQEQAAPGASLLSELWASTAPFINRIF